MKILVVGNYYYPEHMGGIEIVSHNLIKYYRDQGHEAHWVAANAQPHFRQESELDIPISAWNITEEKLGFPHPLPAPNVLGKLFRQVTWCDIVHLQDTLYPINILAFLLARLLYKPILITQYAKIIPYNQLYKRILQNIAYKTIGWMMFKLADKVVCITTNVRDNMNYITPENVWEVVPLGVDVDFYAPLSNTEREILRKELSGEVQTPIVLFVGRMVERKGIHLLRPLVEKYRNWHWVFVGRPDDHNPGKWELPNLTYFQNISNEVLRNLYASADILVHPSSGEGITLTISECMACGTPVVVSEESLHEVDENDKELFFPVLPETDQIEKALLYAFDSNLSLMREKIRDYALKRLSWGKMTEAYLEILKKLLMVFDNNQL